MKFFFVLFTLLSIQTFAQGFSSLESLINKIEQGDYNTNPTLRHYSSKPPIEFNEKYFKGVIEEYTISEVTNGSFSVSQISQPNSLFYFTKRNGLVKGVLLDTTKSIGYKFHSENGIISFQEIPKTELLYNCSFDHSNHSNFPPLPIIRKDIGNFVTSDVLTLESTPNSPNLIYLDFEAKSIARWELDYTFVEIPDSDKRLYWSGISEIFTGFDVNITTNKALYDIHPKINKMKVVFAKFLTQWNGTAPIDAFGGDYPALVNIGSIPEKYYVSLVAAHEIGHVLGLNHDGSATETPYYSGHGEYSPIMGNGNNPFPQWSKGEYATATNSEDDIAIMTTLLGKKKDDNTNPKALFIKKDGSIDPEFNQGVIESSNDIDEFLLKLNAAGNINLSIGSPKSVTLLDALVNIYDSNNNLLHTYNPIGERSVTIQKNLDAGEYKLTVEGGGELTVNDGWSDYSSQGYYEISGSIENYTLDNHDLFFKNLLFEDDFCGSQFTPQIEVYNNGLATITSFDVDIIIDGALDHTETITTSITSEKTATISLEPISTIGEHSLEVKASLPNATESILANNSVTKEYNLTDGNLLIFTTDIPTYNGNSPITWDVTQNATTMQTSSLLEVSDVNGNKQQRFCLTKGCSDFNITKKHNSCSGFPQYTRNLSASEKAVYLGKLYEAKWSTNGNPEDGTGWKLLYSCDPTPYNVSLKVSSNDSLLFTKHSDTFGNSLKQNLCLESEVTTENKINTITRSEIILQNNILKIPTAFIGGSIKWINTSGQIVFSNKIYDESLVINSNLPKGIYFTNIEKGSLKSNQFVFVK